MPRAMPVARLVGRAPIDSGIRASGSVALRGCRTVRDQRQTNFIAMPGNHTKESGRLLMLRRFPAVGSPITNASRYCLIRATNLNVAGAFAGPIYAANKSRAMHYGKRRS
jgi:hypothetical protein